jgi:hypothetical protein
VLCAASENCIAAPGAGVGAGVGAGEGAGVGDGVGAGDGAGDGVGAGDGDGEGDGVGVGAGVGAGGVPDPTTGCASAASADSPPQAMRYVEPTPTERNFRNVRRPSTGSRSPWQSACESVGKFI